MALFIEIERPDRGYVVSTTRDGGDSVTRVAFGETERAKAIAHIETLLDQEEFDRVTTPGHSN